MKIVFFKPLLQRFIVSVSFFFIFANIALSDPQVVFTGGAPGNWEICLLEDIKKEEPINLTQHPANESEPSWSEDGKKIAFISDRDGNTEIYSMNIETREVERITHNSGPDENPDWCPKGRKIVFLSKREDSGGIYIMDTLTKEIVRITKNMHVYNVAWTPDGKRIAFPAILEGNEAIYSIDPYGKVPVSSPGECEVIVEEPPPGTNDIARWGFSFTPDLSMITFDARTSGGDCDIYTMDLSTGEFQNLTSNSPKHDRYPCWSPDGKFIAFSSSREGSIGRYDIYFITPERKVIEQLKLSGLDFDPDIFDPDFAYSVSPLIDSKACTWGEIKR